MTNLDDDYFDDAVRFGGALQSEHAAIAEAELALASDEALQAGQRALANMIQILVELDPDRVFAVRRPTVVDKLKALVDPVQPPADTFAQQYPQLVALANELRGLEARLIEHARQAQTLDDRYRLLCEQIAVHILAARFLVRAIRADPERGPSPAHYASQADVLEARAASLLATQATVELGRVNNEILRRSVQTLIAAGRGMLEEDLPAFHTAYTAALNAAANAATTAGGIDEFASAREVHARIMRKIQGDA